MRKFLAVSTILVAAAGLTGCYSAPVMPPPGLLYASIEAPLDVNMQQTEVSPKSGEASAASILGLFAFGDASIHAAAVNGGVQTVDYADYEFLNILGIYQSFTTRVHGQ